MMFSHFVESVLASMDLANMPDRMIYAELWGGRLSMSSLTSFSQFPGSSPLFSSRLIKSAFIDEIWALVEKECPDYV